MEARLAARAAEIDRLIAEVSARPVETGIRGTSDAEVSAETGIRGTSDAEVSAGSSAAAFETTAPT
jgi:hypothetical protein